MRTFVIGDIHGAHRALLQCFERSGFDRARDRLIALGDVCDGYREVRPCIDELLTVKRCDYILGNHDSWALQWATEGFEQSIWLTQGGEATVRSYDGGPMPQAHVEFLKKARLWIEWDNKLFVHGGIDPDKAIGDHDREELIWDRSLVERAWEASRDDPDVKFSSYDEIIVGHTTTLWIASNKMTDVTPKEAAALGSKPMFLGNVTMLDTGAGWGGKLTIMDTSTHEYWQSDPTSTLYRYSSR